MADRKKLKSANGMYLGSTGSGKSFAAKRELLNVFLTIPQDRIIVVDPMGEYAPLVRRLGGQVIEIAPDSPHHLNPMDVELNMAAGESPLSMKADFLLSLCELVVGGKEGLQPIEKTVIDRCVRLVYREQALGLETAKTPLLQDLYEELLRQPEPEARRVATALELYCTGSLNLFNHPTNVNLNSRVVCFVLKGMGENLCKIAMHITNDFVTSAVCTYFINGVATWCYFDEFHILLRDPLTASYFVTVWKMLRKQGCVPVSYTRLSLTTVGRIGKGYCILAYPCQVRRISRHTFAHRKTAVQVSPYGGRLFTVSYTHLVNNLIQNVIAHSHADKIKISLSKKENNMELLLADNGVGIEKEDLKHIFERLYKCDKGRSEQGSGLGLSLVHQLVEKMGGSITVESLPGKGTEFMLLFPLEI